MSFTILTDRFREYLSKNGLYCMSVAEHDEATYEVIHPIRTYDPEEANYNDMQFAWSSLLVKLYEANKDTYLLRIRVELHQRTGMHEGSILLRENHIHCDTPNQLLGAIHKELELSTLFLRSVQRSIEEFVA